MVPQNERYLFGSNCAKAGNHETIPNLAAGGQICLISPHPHGPLNWVFGSIFLVCTFAICLSTLLETKALDIRKPSVAAVP